MLVVARRWSIPLTCSSHHSQYSFETILGNREIEPEIRGREKGEPGIGQVLCSTLSVVP